MIEFEVSASYYSDRKITQSEFNKIMNKLSEISDDKYKFKLNATGIYGLEVTPDPKPDPWNLVAHNVTYAEINFGSYSSRDIRLQKTEVRLEKLLKDIESIKSEIECIRKND